MDTIFLDFETYYDDEYSLRKMTPVEYILDPRFECIGCAVKRFGMPLWIEGPDMPKFFASLDPGVTSMVTHNALFDMCIVAWRYGFIPRLMVDTLGVARATIQHECKSLALGSLARHLELGFKDTQALTNAKGLHLEDLKRVPAIYDRYKQYALSDVSMCEGIYDKLVRSGRFPVSELAVMDMVLRTTIQPQFVFDQDALYLHLAEVQAKKQALLDRVSVDKSELMSNDKFAAALRNLGVEPPTKISPTTGKEAFAFAKNDAAFIELGEHPSPDVQALVCARLGHKSTIEETRTQRFINISQLQWPVTMEGNAPMPLRFSGAHTHRLSGDWKLNVQNLSRGGRLRKALKAKPGYKVLAVDSSQVEARGVATISGCQVLINLFETGADVYSVFASEVFGRPINKKNDPSERFVGKQAVLGLGYGLGWVKFKVRLKSDSFLQTGTTIELSDEEAMRVVNTYRTLYREVPSAWHLLNSLGIHALNTGDRFSFGPCEFEKHAIRLPNGLKLHYHNLRREGSEWWFDYAGMTKKIYGGKLLENIIQALSRIATMDAALRSQKRAAVELGKIFRLALQVHDELVFVVPDEFVEAMKRIMYEEMLRRPWWMPNLPLGADPVGCGQSYGDAK